MRKFALVIFYLSSAVLLTGCGYVCGFSTILTKKCLRKAQSRHKQLIDLRELVLLEDMEDSQAIISPTA